MKAVQDVLGILGRSATGRKVIAEAEAVAKTGTDRQAAAEALNRIDADGGEKLAELREERELALLTVQSCREALAEAQANAANAIAAITREAARRDGERAKAEGFLRRTADERIGEFITEMRERFNLKRNDVRIWSDEPMGDFNLRTGLPNLNRRTNEVAVTRWCETINRVCEQASAMMLNPNADGEVAERLAALRHEVETAESRLGEMGKGNEPPEQSINATMQTAKPTRPKSLPEGATRATPVYAS